MAKIRKSKLMRCSKELMDVINFVRARYIMDGKKPPRISDITRVISKRVEKEDILKNVLIEL